MSELYEELRDEVAELLAELGGSVTFTRYTVVNDLVEGTSVPTPSSTQDLSCAVIPATSLMGGFDIVFMKGVMVTAQVKLGLVSTLGASFVPRPGDTMDDGAKVWRVFGITPLNVDNTVDVLFIVGLEET